MIIALALVGGALGACAVVVAQRNARNEPVWFAVSGLARFSIAFGLLALALVAADHVSSFLIAVAVLIVVCLLAGGVAQLLRTARRTRRLRLLTAGRISPSRLLLLVVLGVLVVLIPGGIVFIVWDSVWLSTHGGGTAVALTGSALVVAALLVSALARLLVSAVLAVVACLEPGAREDVIRSTFASLWDSGEAIGVAAAAILSFAAIGLGVWSQQSRSTFAHAVAPGEPVRSLASATPRQLLTGLAPVLTFTGRDAWPPQRVDGYLAASTVFDLRGSKRMADPGTRDLVDPCPGAATPCLLIDAGCARTRCVRGARSARAVAYGRLVLRKDNSRVSWGISPFRNTLAGIAQWWIFAPYDRWTAPLFLGLGTAVQEHAADWEAVTIGFSRVRPLFVALSSHCGGTWRQYRDVDVTPERYTSADALGARLHTLVAYADGSHALYFEPDRARTPDAAGCAVARASGWFRAVSYTANALDTTGDNARRLLTPVVGPEATRVLSFPAYWSASNTYTFKTPFAVFRTTAGTAGNPGGPGAPAKKDLFVDPVHTIFCEGTWHYEPSDDAPDSNLPTAAC